jgi:hypothetical protein
MKRLEFLIEDSRRDSENETFSETAGIGDEEFIRWANAGQERIQSKIAKLSQKIFTKEETIPLIQRQEAYDLPSDTYIENRVSLVEFSNTGRDSDFFPLDQGTLRERRGFQSFAQPRFYIRRGGQLLMSPVPDSSTYKIRVTYVRRLQKLDIRRAQIDTVVTGAGNTITSLTLKTSAVIDDVALATYTQFSVVDKDGIQTMRSIPYDSIDTGSGIVTITPGFAFEDGETITADDYLVAYPNGTNQSEMPDTLERYLVEFMNMKAANKDSSNDSSFVTPDFIEMENEILTLFAEPDDDILTVPLLSQEFTGDEFV